MQFKSKYFLFECRHTYVYEYAYEYYAYIQYVCMYTRPIHICTCAPQACIDDNESICKLLLEFGADVNGADTECWTPLHAAATCGNVRICKMLIDK
jgi:hypothetical protein